MQEKIKINKISSDKRASSCFGRIDIYIFLESKNFVPSMRNHEKY
jgi:hypothetical protein